LNCNLCHPNEIYVPWCKLAQTQGYLKVNTLLLRCIKRTRQKCKSQGNPLTPVRLCFAECGVFFRMWCYLSNVVYFVECGVFCRMWCILSNVVYFTECGVFYRMWCILSN
uniref:Uncharacterized protein n=1 Tax=Ciona savignyi TaxID=51511 RepID=H2ZA00_CIOSA